MYRISNIKLPVQHSPEDLWKKAANVLRITPRELVSLQIRKKSLDARKKPNLVYLYTVDVAVAATCRLPKKLPDSVTIPADVVYQIPAVVENPPKISPVVIGLGPAGLFCAYILAKAGLRPIVIERGKRVEDRIRDVEKFWQEGVLNLESNVQFGEGGAGTFSDGKLNTLVKEKYGRNRFVLETFVKFGAPEAILYEARPHIGTDILVDVVRNMRNAILEMGGSIRYESRVNHFVCKQGKLQEVQLETGETIQAEQVVLAIGHSSRDTFEELHRMGISMEAKSFAVGFRVEHPRRMIDESQYGIQKQLTLPAANYKLTAATANGRGVYTFCMCPGGYVVNASSEEGRLVVNGMSYSGRNGQNSNSAVIISVSPEDFPGEGPLSGVAYQRMLEERAYALGKGKVPVQKYGAFCNGNDPHSEGCYETSFSKEEQQIGPQIKGAYSFENVRELLPEHMNAAFMEAMEFYGKRIKGYDDPCALIDGIESRTSSPVRICRQENGMSPSLEGLYPCGEGAGYAGGITSAAMDGMYIAEQVIHQLRMALER